MPETLDIQSFVQETVARVTEEQEEKQRQDAEEYSRRSAEKLRWMQSIKQLLGHISVELKCILIQSPDLQKLLALKEGPLWKDIPNTRVIRSDQIYANYPTSVSLDLVGYPLEKEPHWEIVLTTHYEGQSSLWPTDDSFYEYVKPETKQELEALLVPRALIEKIVRIALE